MAQAGLTPAQSHVTCHMQNSPPFSFNSEVLERTDTFSITVTYEASYHFLFLHMSTESVATYAKNCQHSRHNCSFPRHVFLLSEDSLSLSLLTSDLGDGERRSTHSVSTGLSYTNLIQIHRTSPTWKKFQHSITAFRSSRARSQEPPTRALCDITRIYSIFNMFFRDPSQ